MSSKRVGFDDGSNSTKEFEKVSSEEKGSIWYSKEEKESNRKEWMLEQTKTLVTKTVLEMEEHKGKAEDDEGVQAAVQAVLDKGVDGVIDFLAKQGEDMGLLPTHSRNPPDGEAAANNGDASPTTSADAEAKQQVRNLVKHQVVVLMQSGVAQFVSQEDLERKTDEIMKLPRVEILRFLEQKPKLPASNKSMKPPAPYNWMNDGTHTWEELPVPIQEAAKVLGFDAESWVSKVQPEASDKVWELLTNEQQEAAIRIGFNPYTWDGVEPSEVGESEHYLEDDSDSSSDDDSDDDEEKDDDPEEAMKNAVREMVRQKLLDAEAFNEDNVDATVKLVMELPKPQIVAFLKHPLPEHWTKPQVPEDETEVAEESEVGGRDSIVFSTFVLNKDEDDDKPMDDSDSDEEEKPKKSLTRSVSDEEETDEFLNNFFSEEDKENIKKELAVNETTPLIPGKGRSSGGDNAKGGPSATSMTLLGLVIAGAVIGWFAFRKMR